MRSEKGDGLKSQESLPNHLSEYSGHLKNLRVIGEPGPTTAVSTPSSRLKDKFLRLLGSDLRRIGVSMTVRRYRKTLRCTLQITSPPREKLVTFMRQERARRLAEESAFVSGLDQRLPETLFASGRNLNFATITPRIEFCSSRRDLEIFRYCRLLQSVPAPRLLYRQIAALVVDDGQTGSPLIGAFGICSPVYSLGCRDKFFGWDVLGKRSKDQGLKACMQLSFCIAVPPYSYLRGGKLIAALAASEEVSFEHERRYGVCLRAVITTSAMGLHSPIFNRIMVRPGGLYKRIGQTSGYSALFFSKETLAAAKCLVEQYDGHSPETTDRPIRTMKRALNICGLPREQLVRMAIPKGVYMACSGEVGSGLRRKKQWPSTREVIGYWKSRELAKAIRNNVVVGIVRRFEGADPKNMLYTECGDA